MSKYSLYIDWEGTAEKVESYTFDSCAELASFLNGLNECHKQYDTKCPVIMETQQEMRSYLAPQYDALIQPNEEEARLDCGCLLRREFGDGSVSLTFCEQHNGK